MREILQNALTSWDKYWDGSIYPYLLLGAALYLLFFEKKRKQAGYLLGYLVITLALMFCPVTAALIEKCIGGMVYWRVVWILPAVPVIALGFTSLLGRIRNAKLQIFPVVLCLLLVAVSGTSVWQAGNYVKVQNNQKVPNEVAQVAEVILNRRKFRRCADCGGQPVWHPICGYMTHPFSWLLAGMEREGVQAMENACLTV